MQDRKKERKKDRLPLLAAAQSVSLTVYCTLDTMLEILLTLVHISLSITLSSHCHKQADKQSAMVRTESWLTRLEKGNCEFSRCMNGDRNNKTRKTSPDSIVLALSNCYKRVVF